MSGSIRISHRLSAATSIMILSAVIVFVLLTFVSCTRTSEKKTSDHGNNIPLRKIKIDGSREIFVEVADTPEKRSRGLMYRYYLPEDRGMLFIFDNPGYYPFYMKDTHVPLSIAFISQELKIVTIAHMKPLDAETLHYPSSPAKYALEMNQGWFKKNGIGLGDRVILNP